MKQGVESFGSQSRSPVRVIGLDEALAKKMLRFLAVSTLALTLLGIVAVVVKHLVVTGHWASQVQESFVRLFDLDAEGNIPTWYSSSLLLCAAGLLGWNSLLAQQRGDPYHRWWTFSAVAFLYLSIDEAAVIHEMAIKPIREVFHTGGLLFYGWIIPAGMAVLGFGAAYFRFWLLLPPRIRQLFALSALIYVGSALGVEAIQGYCAQIYGEGSWAYDWLAVIEESGEMSGIVLFNYAVLLHAIDAITSSVESHRMVPPDCTSL